MAKVKPKSYFQFPLCLLTLDLPVKEWAQLLIGYVGIEKGRVLRSKIPAYWFTSEPLSEADEADLLARASREDERLYNARQANGSSMIGEIIASQRRKGNLPGGFDESNPDHQAVALMIRTGAFLKGHMPTIELRHAGAVRHVEAFEKLAGKDRQLRVRSDALWMLHDGKMREREFRVLVGMYSQIEGRSTPGRVTYEDWAYRAAGYKGRKAYEAVHGAAVLEKKAGPAEQELAGIAAYVLDASSLPPVGDGRSPYPDGAGSPYYKGQARYDLVFWNVPLSLNREEEEIQTGDFVPVLTRSGVRYRWHGHPQTKPPVTAVREAEAEHGPGAPYPDGTWIVWQDMERGRPLLLIGRVTGFDAQRRVLLAEHQGQVVEVRLSGNPAPVGAVLDELAMLPAASDAATAAPTFRRGPLYTQDQLRTTREKMERPSEDEPGWWSSYSIGRRAYYSITLSSEEIREWVVKKEARPVAKALNRQALRAGHSEALKAEVERLVPALAERRRAEEADAQRVAQEEAQRKAVEAQRVQVEANKARHRAAQEEAERQETERRRLLHEHAERQRAVEEAEDRRLRESAERRREEADERRRGRGVAVPPREPLAGPHTPQHGPTKSPALPQL